MLSAVVVGIGVVVDVEQFFVSVDRLLYIVRHCETLACTVFQSVAKTATILGLRLAMLFHLSEMAKRKNQNLKSRMAVRYSHYVFALTMSELALLLSSWS